MPVVTNNELRTVLERKYGNRLEIGETKDSKRRNAVYFRYKRGSEDKVFVFFVNVKSLDKAKAVELIKILLNSAVFFISLKTLPSKMVFEYEVYDKLININGYDLTGGKRGELILNAGMNLRPTIPVTTFRASGKANIPAVRKGLVNIIYDWKRKLYG